MRKLIGIIVLLSILQLTIAYELRKLSLEDAHRWAPDEIKLNAKYVFIKYY